VDRPSRISGFFSGVRFESMMTLIFSKPAMRITDLEMVEKYRRYRYILEGLIKTPHDFIRFQLQWD
jgi:hypothetical protein